MFKIFSIALIFSTSFGMAAEPLENQKDIEVFQKILITMLDLDGGNHRFQTYEPPVQATYLKNQGLLIELDAKNATRYAFFKDFDFPELSWNVEAPEIPPVPEIAFREQAQAAAELEALEEKVAREYESEEANMEWFETEKAYLEKNLKEELNQARKERREAKAKMEQELDRLREQVEQKAIKKAELEEKLKQAKEEIHKSFTARKKELDALKAKHQKNWQEDAKKMEATLLDALCQYGTTIRDVKDGEYFTLLLRDFNAPDEKGHRSDRVYVIPRSSIFACRDGKMTQQEVIQTAETYSIY